MRTRVFNKMTAQEVEDYLARGGDTIYLGIGVVEVHGEYPIDCETILPEAVALAMAEEADGLAMINLPYFYPGGTVSSNATVHLTIRDGIDYLMKIGHSLVKQGFKRIYVISGHGPSLMTLNAFSQDFFHETLIHPCHMSLVAMMANTFGPKAMAAGPAFMDGITYGAYKMMGQLDYIPIDPNAKATAGEIVPVDPAMGEFMRLYGKYCPYSTAQVFSDPRQHGGGRIFKSREEMEAFAAEGEKTIYEMVSKLHVKELNDALGEYQEYVQATAKKFPRIQVK